MPIVAVIGPTAVGKTAMSLDLARALNAEVISVDSRQVYRYMDVGTDKISREVRREIPHHLIDAGPDQVYTASDFTAQAADCVKRIMARGRTPLFVGGTPFYYQALFSRNFRRPSTCPRTKNCAPNFLPSKRTNSTALLKTSDPESAARLHPNDKFRVSRALEIFLLSGRPASEWYRERPSESPYDVLYLGLFAARHPRKRHRTRRLLRAIPRK